jgi:PhnB protein
MFCTHIFFNGNCLDAIELYKRAFQAELLTLIMNEEGGKEQQVTHAEMLIHGQKLMLNDFGNQQGISTPDGYQLVVQFESVDALEAAYRELETGARILTPKGPTDYSPCVTQLIDRFGTRWAFMV